MSAKKTFTQETARLRHSWDKYDHDTLDTYLVAGVEDPRINFQSILTRALILDSLFPGKYTDLVDAEWRFGMCLTWIVQQREQGQTSQAIMSAIEGQEDAACPAFIRETYAYLQSSENPVPDYITDALFVTVPAEQGTIAASVLSTFEFIWDRLLATETVEPISILELACGSANDYRFLDSFGLAQFLDYTGLDIAEKNIENARHRFPNISFQTGSAMDIPLADQSVDYLFVHDLFEHLSTEAMETALKEVARVTRKQAWLSFFRLDTIPEHDIVEVEEYHWNRLSQDVVCALLDDLGGTVEVIAVPEMVHQKFGYSGYHNPTARTLLITFS